MYIHPLLEYVCIYIVFKRDVQLYVHNCTYLFFQNGYIQRLVSNLGWSNFTSWAAAFTGRNQLVAGGFRGFNGFKTMERSSIF